MLISRLLSVVLISGFALGATMTIVFADVPSQSVKILGAESNTEAVIGIGMRNNLWIQPTQLDTGWHPIPDSGNVIGVTVIPPLSNELPSNGTILGVGTRGWLWTRATLESTWKVVPDSEEVVDVAVMSNGTILGVGTEPRLLKKRETLNSEWKLVEPQGLSLIGVAVMSNGTILGVGTDLWIYPRATLNSNWGEAVGIRDQSMDGISGNVYAATALSNGTILAVNGNNWVYRRAKLESQWELVPKSCCLKSISAWNSSPLTRVSVSNSTRSRIRFVAYRADGIRPNNGILETNSYAEVSDPGETVHMTFNNDGLGYFILTAYIAPGPGETPSASPGALGVKQAVEGGGGSIGITIAGFGGSIGGSGTGTKFFANPLAMSGLRSGSYELVEEAGRVEFKLKN